jgi:hypothetical protein
MNVASKPTIRSSCPIIRAMCESIRDASRFGRFPDPQVLPATMQELSIKKVLANDLKKNVDIVFETIFMTHSPIYPECQRYSTHYIFWEEPQMSGRKLRKEGYLSTKLVMPPTAIQRLTAATLKSHRSTFETWKNAYVTLR